MLGFFSRLLRSFSRGISHRFPGFSYRKEDKLTHRDFLGSFMAQGVERPVWGDILVGEGLSVAFLRQEMGEYFFQSIRKIGRVGVKTTLSLGGPTPCGP